MPSLAKWHAGSASLVAAAAVVMFTSGCGGDGQNAGPGPIATATPTPTPTPSASPTPSPSPSPSPTPTPTETTTYSGHSFGPPNPNDRSLQGFGRGLGRQGNLDDLPLGPVLSGPVSTPFPGPFSTTGSLTVTVHCPPGATPCTTSLPPGSIYTYVLRVVPGYGGRGTISSFRPAFPIRGITSLGLSASQAIAAAPDPNVGPFAFCETTGHIAWRFPSTQSVNWTGGELITFYFQSTAPPAATGRRYEFTVPEGRGTATAPGTDDGVPGGCDGLP